MTSEEVVRVRVSMGMPHLQDLAPVPEVCDYADLRDSHQPSDGLEVIGASLDVPGFH